jgi:argininosuccinate lyase
MAREKGKIICMKLWQKDYKLNKRIEEFTVGADYILDQNLVVYDCVASIAHTKMLGKIGILEREEVKKLVSEINNIIELDRKGKFKILKEQEDCHTAIEAHLTKKLGDLGKKIHTARSRNDQVLTALRLYYRDQLQGCKGLVDKLLREIKKFVKTYGEIKFPGYTHSRKAMPSSVALWGNALIDAMKDNLKALDFALEYVDQSPLGTGSGYGIPLEIDRKYTAKLLDFKRVQENPIYAANSRGKYEAAILHVLSQTMYDLNKITCDLILFSLPELGYFELPEELCTGSSLMPQKKNPDVLEVLRARYHVVVSYEFQIKNIIGNLLSGYNRDLQLTKEPTMKGFEITKESLYIARLVFSKLKVNEVNCRRALTEDIHATEEVFELVKKGIPFRDAYKTVSKKF